MKQKYKWLVGAMMGGMLCAGTTSCVDEIKFGNSFLEKAPGGAATQDTVFNSVTYTRQFLNTCYSRQYYGLPYVNSNVDDFPDSSNPYTGKFDALTDCWQLHYSATTIYNNYYSGTHTASDNDSGKVRGDIFGFTREVVWQTVRWCWLLLENVDKVPGMSDEEKIQMKAEAKCLIAARYFDMFRHYGGLPLIYASFTGTESDYSMPRATVEETVNYMDKMLEDAIYSGGLKWAYEGADATSDGGHWTLAGAMALRCKIWQFAASPLFNDTQGYAGGYSEAEQQRLVWYGSKRSDLWDKCLEYCRQFFNAIEANRFYELQQATGANPTPAEYRYAYRMGYIRLESPEVLHSVRVAGYERPGGSTTYIWRTWCNNGRNSYTPTQEYVEMFPWSDGRPFDWDETEAEGKLDEMFLKGEFADGEQTLSDIELTRDPRLYESAIINNIPENLGWSAPVMSGDPYELWVGGTDAGTNSNLETGRFATGYDNMKYYLSDSDYQRQPIHWVYLRLSDLYLTYAEALLQSEGNFTEALKWVNKVRARVGLDKLENFCPEVTSDKDALLEEILRERACELGMEDSRYFDLKRYKRADRFETPLHGLLIYRLDDDGNRIEKPWRDGTDQYGKNKGALQPTKFEYEKFTLHNRARIWWTQGFDPKWYLSPFPQSEINKGYGLVQNPGW